MFKNLLLKLRPLFGNIQTNDSFGSTNRLDLNFNNETSEVRFNRNNSQTDVSSPSPGTSQVQPAKKYCFNYENMIFKFFENELN